MLDLTIVPERPLIAPSILSADFGCVAADARDALERGADMLHIDVMDGHFAANLTMGQDMIRALRKHLPEAFLDVHLMVERPGDYVESFAKAGANLFNFHAEVCAPYHPAGLDAEELIERIRQAGMRVGMTVNPYTPASHVQPFIGMLDMVLAMSVVPGASGQRFMPEVLPKVRELRAMLPDRVRLEMDGGVSPETAQRCREAGADVFVTGSAFFGKAPGPERDEVVRALKGES